MSELLEGGTSHRVLPAPMSTVAHHRTQEEDDEKQQEAARAAKAARKPKRKQQKQGKQTSDVNRPGEQQERAPAEPELVREPAAASDVTVAADSESPTAEAANAQPPASGTAAGAAEAAQDADTAWQLCPLSKVRARYSTLHCT